jgi:Trypsin-co-occurring domain 2
VVTISDHGVPLAAAIEALRDELTIAMAQGQDRPLRFEVTNIDLTLQTTVTWSGEANAGIKWWLIDAGVKASRESEAVQTIVLNLAPKQADESGRFRQSAMVDAADG